MALNIPMLPNRTEAKVVLENGESFDTVDLMTLAEASRYAEVSRTGLTHWIEGRGAGKGQPLKHVLIGTTPYVIRDHLDAFLARRERQDSRRGRPSRRDKSLMSAMEETLRTAFPDASDAKIEQAIKNAAAEFNTKARQ